MKHYLNSITAIVCGIILFAACEKKISSISYADNGTPPVLSAGSDTIALVPADSLSTALALTWTNPAYAFSNGISSLNVNYNIQIDTAGANFSNASNIIQTVASDLSASFTVARLNSFLGNTLSLKNGMQHIINVRVASFLNQSSLLLYSNVLTFIVTPYAPPPKVNPPSSGELYIIGSALTGNGDGWNNPVNATKYQFSKTDDLNYTITVALHGGQEYLFIPVNGDWSHKYACKSKASQSADGGDFGADLSDNFPGPATDGTYKIDVNFQLGKYTVTKQ